VAATAEYYVLTKFVSCFFACVVCVRVCVCVRCVCVLVCVCAGVFVGLVCEQ
jgi:hypothetical protein